MEKFSLLITKIEKIPQIQYVGRIIAVRGILAECSGIEKFVSIGSRCNIKNRQNRDILCEVVGFKGKTVLLMPFSDLAGVGMGCEVSLIEEEETIRPTSQWSGRVINALAVPVDGKGVLPQGNKAFSLVGEAINAHNRQRVKEKINLGVKAINTFTTCCKGQRLGIFSGSGIGKSVLISMLAKYCSADVKVIGLIGERGREVQEFLQDYLGEDGLKNAVVVVATGNESALMRKKAAYLTMTIAEYFRDEGKDVLCLMDSITRFAMAQREIGLSAGEPPTTKGYTPTVFSELPKLLERAGPGTEKGSITGLFSVLVEGDDHNEPISDAVRGILDGHIVLDREIAQRGRFPAINILKSVSRTMPGCNNDEQNALVTRARQLLAVYENMAELIKIGAYKKGSDAKVDEAITYYDALENFLRQKPNESFDIDSCYNLLAKVLQS